jgi:hypothetical protein
MADYALHYGRSPKPLLFVVADPDWPPMYRVKRLDGQLSGLLNLTRAREAGRLIGRYLVSSHEPNRLHWKEARQGCGRMSAGEFNRAAGTLVALRVQNEPTLAPAAAK